MSEWGDSGSGGHRGRRQFFGARAMMYHRNAQMSRVSLPRTQEIFHKAMEPVSYFICDGIVQLRHTRMPADGPLAAGRPDTIQIVAKKEDSTMPYITTKREARPKQVSFLELLAGPTPESACGGPRSTATWTYNVREIRPDLLAQFGLQGAINALADFNRRHAELFDKPRRELYNSFCIPKKSGGLRQIDAPKEDLMAALRELKQIFERDCFALYHTSAYAYVPGRCTIDAVKQHQRNDSHWFCKLDFANFFGRTTPEFVLRMLTDVFPFSEICKREDGRRELTKALDLCFLTGTDPQNPRAQGLPQGTPISPLLTNLMMIPIDHTLTKRFREKRMVYTRYADDLLISSRQGFSSDEAENVVREVLEYFHAPFAVKPEKTRYGSRSGSNWNLGVVLNKDNEITIGWRQKKHFHAMLNNYILDRRGGTAWPLEDVMQFNGLISYYKMVEKAAIEQIIAHYDQKYRVDAMALIKADIAA